jgi:hypothetical protein
VCTRINLNIFPVTVWRYCYLGLCFTDLLQNSQECKLKTGELGEMGAEYVQILYREKNNRNTERIQSLGT